MSKNKIKKVVVLGSGGLRIGQAGEFDYSGSQAIKALRQHKIKSVLVNPNIATVQTDTDMADEVYFQPLQLDVVTKILERERPDAIMLSFGGQTALNLGLQLHDSGVLERLDIEVLGTPVGVIKTTEDRELFKNALAEIGTKTARSLSAETLEQAVSGAKKLGYPVMMRSAYSLGGLGSGRIANEKELRTRVREVLAAVPQVLIEEYLTGWKEVEYEVVRDRDGNTVTVCNMENFDPMGVHTGESIVVAPSQTLTNDEYHNLRRVAIDTINHLGIVGECNIQYALNPENGDYRVIEVNARLSRSSALASKATGYPLAYVAAQLMLGKRLYEIKNVVTGRTSAFYEPALDYIALKVPRWDLSKLKASDHRIGSEMKSVGEVMALGRSFPEVLQKAVRMLGNAGDGLVDHTHEFDDPMDDITRPTDRRLYAVHDALKSGITTDEIHRASWINPWFLDQISRIVEAERTIKTAQLDKDTLRRLKQLGFSDHAIALRRDATSEKIRSMRIKHGVIPSFKQIDTLAGEFDAETNYLYVTYHGDGHDIDPLEKPSVMILGSGPYAIGSSVEFDWSAVNTAKALQKHGRKTIIINSNPETVSTDFDRSDRLYFDELTEERVRDIADFEHLDGIVVSVGGQVANNLAPKLHRANYKILGTSAVDIDRAENRQKFSSLLGELGIDQPEWIEATTMKAAEKFAAEVGYPLLIRPSYVLSGGAMNVVKNAEEMKQYIGEATKLSREHPVVISQYISNAKELEIDGVAQEGRLLIYAISEHIENAGVHSGDATVVYPAQKLYIETIRRAKHIARGVVKELHITGPFNIQFIARDNDLKVIETNVRASRSFPFVSKVSGHNFIEIATEAMLGIPNTKRYQTLELDHVGVKSPQFSYNRLKGADPVAGVEMASTGEVACFGRTFEEAFYESWRATEQRVAGKHVLISLPDEEKHKFVDEARILAERGWRLYATAGTKQYFDQHGVECRMVHKIREKRSPSVADIITDQKIDLVVCVPSPDTKDIDGYTIRRLSVDNHIPIFTNAQTGRLILECLGSDEITDIDPQPWSAYLSD